MVTIDQAKCTGCGLCVADCVFNSLKLDGQKAALDGRCIRCGHCVAICPVGAVSIPEYDMPDVQELGGQSFNPDPEKLLQTIKFRRSIRKFTSQKIEQAKLDRLIQAGRYTATGSNAQGCKFIVVQNELATLKEMVWQGAEAYLHDGKKTLPDWTKALQGFVELRKTRGIDFLFRNAPAILYIVAESPIDAGLAAQNIELMAVAQGLGVMFNGFVARLTNAHEPACAWLNVGSKPIATSMLLGYPDVHYRRSAPRKPANVIWL